MPRFRVAIPYCVWQTIEVEADNEEAAEDAAFEVAGLSGYCGNGGTDKLVGCRDSSTSIEACSEHIDVWPFEVHVEQA